MPHSAAGETARKEPVDQRKPPDGGFMGELAPARECLSPLAFKPQGKSFFTSVMAELRGPTLPKRALSDCGCRVKMAA
jgi:hypothetical protein